MHRHPKILPFALSLALLGLLSVLALPAAAQPASGSADARFELTPFVGYRLDGELDDADLGFAFSDFEPEVDESSVYGVSLGFALNANMLIEVLVSQQDTDLVLRPIRRQDEVLVADITLTTVHAGFVYQWRLGQVDPYVVASGGITRVDLDRPGGSDDSRLSGSIGGGVKLRFTDHLGLRLEGRLFVTDFDAEFGDDDDRRFERDDVLYQPEGSVGLLISF